MSDSLEHLSGYSLFEPTHNWKESPSLELQNKKWMLQFPGGPSILSKYLEGSLEGFTRSMYFRGREAIYNFLENYTKTYKARFTPFWIPAIGTRFSLYSGILATDFTVQIEKTAYVARDKNLLYIKTISGDRITRRILSKAESSNYDTLYLASSIGRNLAISDVESINLLLFCRFDTDSIEMTYKTPEIANVNAKFVEVHESPFVPPGSITLHTSAFSEVVPLYNPSGPGDGSWDFDWVNPGTEGGANTWAMQRNQAWWPYLFRFPITATTEPPQAARIVSIWRSLRSNGVSYYRHVMGVICFSFWLHDPTGILGLGMPANLADFGFQPNPYYPQYCHDNFAYRCGVWFEKASAPPDEVEGDYRVVQYADGWPTLARREPQVVYEELLDHADPPGNWIDKEMSELFASAFLQPSTYIMTITRN